MADIPQAPSPSPQNGDDIQYDAPAAQPLAAPPGEVHVISPEGKLGTVPSHQLEDAINEGFQQASQADLDSFAKQKKYGSAGQQALTGLEGAGEAATFGLSTGAETAMGVDPADIQGRREVNPGTHMLGQAAGLTASALVPGVGEANVLEHAGAGAAGALGLGAEGAGIASKIGSTAVKGAVENALFQSGDEVSKMLSKDPNQSVETAAANIGLGGLIGGGVGGAIGSISPLWKATMGTKLGGILKAVTDKAGGIEGVNSDAVDNAIKLTGIEMPPEIRAALSDDPQLQGMAKTLEQSDTTSSGQKYQEALGGFKKRASEIMVQAFGKDPEALAAGPELSKYEAGQNIGKTLAGEYQEKLDPIAKEFEDLKEKYKDAPLVKDGQTVDHYDQPPYETAESNPKINKIQAQLDAVRKQRELVESEQAFNARNREPGAPERLQTNEEWGGLMRKESALQDALAKEEAALDVRNASMEPTPVYAHAPGTTSQIAEKLAALAQQEGWVGADNEIEREFNRVMKRLPEKKTLSELSGLNRQIGMNTSDPMNRELMRAGSLMKKVIQDAQDDVAIQHLGQEGPELVERFKNARDAYRQQSQLREALNDRLKVGGSTSGFGKSVREMATTDGETLLNRISGKNDANLLSFLEANFPKTAQALKDFHVENTLKTAMDKAKPGETINPAALRKAIETMSPELRKFAISGDAQAKVDAIGKLLDQLNKVPHNFSNTARTMDKLLGFLPGSAVGMATMLAGHNPAMAVLLGGLTKVIGRDAPDAARLALLKFLGAGQPIEAEGFKSMVDMIHHTIQGETLVNRATKNIFRAGQDVLAESQLPSEAERTRLDKSLQKIDAEPQRLINVAGATGHYMPEHATAAGQVAANAVNYLKSVRPNNEPRSPLDTKVPPTLQQKNAYNRALDIAQQPLVVLHRIQQGRLTPQDVVAFKSMYPALYGRISQKIMDNLADHVQKGNTVPYRTRIGLSLLLGQPLDSTLTPEGIQAAQPKQPMAQPGTATQPQSNPKHSMTALNKVPSMYQTAGQRAEASSRAKD